MSRIHFGALLTVCLLWANTTAAQDRGPGERPAAARLERILRELNASGEKVREQLKEAKGEGDAERIERLKAEVQLIEKKISDTKMSLQKQLELRVAEKQAAAELDRQLQEWSKAEEQVLSEIRAAEKDGDTERVAKLKNKAQRIAIAIKDAKRKAAQVEEAQVNSGKPTDGSPESERRAQLKQAEAKRKAADQERAEPAPERRPRQDLIIERSAQVGELPNNLRLRDPQMEQMRSAERMLREGGLDDLANEVRNRANRWEQELRRRTEQAIRQPQESQAGPEREREIWRRREEALQQRELALREREEAFRRETDVFRTRQREMLDRMKAEREKFENEHQRARQELDQERQRLRVEFFRAEQAPRAQVREGFELRPSADGVNPQRIGNALGEMKKSMDVFKQELRKLRAEVSRLKEQAEDDEDEDEDEDDDEEEEEEEDDEDDEEEDEDEDEEEGGDGDGRP